MTIANMNLRSLNSGHSPYAKIGERRLTRRRTLPGAAGLDLDLVVCRSKPGLSGRPGRRFSGLLDGSLRS